MDTILFRVINTLGLLILTLITIADMVGVLGTGIGIYLCISILREYFTIIKTDKYSDTRILNLFI